MTDARSRSDGAGSAAANTDVLLLCMPWNSLLFPSLGLSLLRGGLVPLGVSVKLRYLNILFAEMIGTDAYLQIAHHTGYDLVGDWIFSGSLFGPENDDIEGYIQHVLRSPAAEHRAFLPSASEERIATVRGVRAAADGFLDACLAEVVALDPRVVGLSCVHHQQVASLALARRIRDRLPDAYVVLGGPGCEGVRGIEIVRQFPFVDAVVSGEGDAVFPTLVRRVLGGEQGTDHLQGVYTRTLPVRPAGNGCYPNAEPERDLDRLPVPEYDDYFEQLAGSPIRASFEQDLLLETSRGCSWGRCTFCSLDGAGRPYRLKSSARVLEEITSLAGRYPGHVIHFADITLDDARFADLVPAMAALDPPARIACHTRCDLTRKQLEALRDAGITMITFGVESLSTRLLQLMRKGVSVLENVQILKWCSELGLEPDWNILWGFAEEPPEAYAEMELLVLSLEHLPPPLAYGRIHVERFSPCFDEAGPMGFTGVVPSPAYRYVFPLPEQSVANLAAYFTYGYRLPQDVDDYTTGLRRAIRRWQQRYPKSQLAYRDDGVQLRIVDRRRVRGRPLTVLSGVERELYLACDGVRERVQLQEIARRHAGRNGAPLDLDALLEPLVEGRLLLRDGESFLGLAVRQASTRPHSVGSTVRLTDATDSALVSAAEVREALRRCDRTRNRAPHHGAE